MKKTDEPIVVEQIFNSSIESVWSAITNLSEMHRWYFENIPSFQPTVGFETKFNVKSETRSFMHLWKVLKVIPNKLIKYNWKYENYTGDSNVIFELFEEEDKTRLKLTVEILADFPESIPEFKRESCEGGWKYFIKDRLKEYLNSTSK